MNQTSEYAIVRKLRNSGMHPFVEEIESLDKKIMTYI